MGQLAHFLTGIHIPDLNSGMRLFKKDICLEIFHILPQRFSFTTTITLAFHSSNYLVKYIPIDYYRRKGASSVQPKEFVHFMKLIFKIVLFFEPLKFFLMPGILLILAGIAYGLYQVLVYPYNLGQTPLLLILVGIQIMFLGLIAELVVRSRRK